MSEQPMYRAFTVVDRQNETPFWLNLGVAFPHKDGKGFNVMLQAMPLNGKLVLRLYEEEPAKNEKPPQAKNGADGDDAAADVA